MRNKILNADINNNKNNVYKFFGSPLYTTGGHNLKVSNLFNKSSKTILANLTGTGFINGSTISYTENNYSQNITPRKRNKFQLKKKFIQTNKSNKTNTNNNNFSSIKNSNSLPSIKSKNEYKQKVNAVELNLNNIKYEDDNDCKYVYRYHTKMDMYLDELMKKSKTTANVNNNSINKNTNLVLNDNNNTSVGKKNNYEELSCKNELIDLIQKTAERHTSISIDNNYNSFFNNDNNITSNNSNKLKISLYAFEEILSQLSKVVEFRNLKNIHLYNAKVKHYLEQEIINILNSLDLTDFIKNRQFSKANNPFLLTKLPNNNTNVLPLFNPSKLYNNRMKLKDYHNDNSNTNRSPFYQSFLNIYLEKPFHHLFKKKQSKTQIYRSFSHFNYYCRIKSSIFTEPQNKLLKRSFSYDISNLFIKFERKYKFQEESEIKHKINTFQLNSFSNNYSNKNSYKSILASINIDKENVSNYKGSSYKQNQDITNKTIMSSPYSIHKHHKVNSDNFTTTNESKISNGKIRNDSEDKKVSGFLYKNNVLSKTVMFDIGNESSRNKRGRRKIMKIIKNENDKRNETKEISKENNSKCNSEELQQESHLNDQNVPETKQAINKSINAIKSHNNKRSIIKTSLQIKTNDTHQNNFNATQTKTLMYDTTNLTNNTITNKNITNNNKTETTISLTNQLSQNKTQTNLNFNNTKTNSKNIHVFSNIKIKKQSKPKKSSRKTKPQSTPKSTIPQIKTKTVMSPLLSPNTSTIANPLSSQQVQQNDNKLSQVNQHAPYIDNSSFNKELSNNSSTSSIKKSQTMNKETQNKQIKIVPKPSTIIPILQSSSTAPSLISRKKTQSKSINFLQIERELQLQRKLEREALLRKQKESTSTLAKIITNTESTSAPQRKRFIRKNFCPEQRKFNILSQHDYKIKEFDDKEIIEQKNKLVDRIRKLGTRKEQFQITEELHLERQKMFLSINNDVFYYLSMKDITERERKLYLAFQKKIRKFQEEIIRRLRNGEYAMQDEIEFKRDYLLLVEELDNINRFRKMERRLNRFMESLNDFRSKSKQVREFQEAQAKPKDSKFVSQTSELLSHDFIEDRFI